MEGAGRLRGPAAPLPLHSDLVARVLADYGFEYSDEEPEEEDVDIENQYYNSKGAPVPSRGGVARMRLHAPAGRGTEEK